MNNDSIIFIGFDTHKPFIQIATLKDERGAKPENYGRINCTKTAIEKFSRQGLAKAGSDEITVREPQYVFAVNDSFMAHRTEQSKCSC